MEGVVGTKHPGPAGEVAIIELTYAATMYRLHATMYRLHATMYRLHATMCRALRLEYDDVDERIVEIAAPGDDGGDVMGTIAMR